MKYFLIIFLFTQQLFCAKKPKSIKKDPKTERKYFTTRNKLLVHAVRDNKDGKAARNQYARDIKSYEKKHKIGAYRKK